MSHVDEGLLHAYIDGAFEAGTPERAGIEEHLAVCADCRVRLDDARRIRDTARTALDAAAPLELEPPPWETVLAERARRGGGSGGALPVTRRPRIPLAWAATVVLALGAGWMARAMLAERGGIPMEPAQTMSAESEDQAAAGRGVADLDAGDAAASLTMPAAEAPPPPAEPPGRPAPEVANAPSPEVATPPATPLFRDERRAESLARQRLGEASQREEATKALALDEVTVTGVAARAAAQLPSALEVAADSARDRWVASSSEAIAAAFDRIPVTVEGQTPDTLQMATVVNRPIARAVYILPSGVVEVLQWPVAEDDAASDTLEAEAMENRTVPRRLRGVEVLVRGSSEQAVREVRGWLR